MRVVLNDGTQIDIGGLKVVDSGVVLFEDQEREKTIGYLPHNQFQYVLTEELIGQIEQSRQRAMQRQSTQGVQQQPMGTRQTVPPQQRGQGQQQPGQARQPHQEANRVGQQEQEQRTQQQSPRDQ
ncbi:hypothetical protein ACFR9U_18095 [Halorientalis brevis]|uniref:Uncharacterized protein n=1 Tax=Halorientalis brevis TaxID=1126241 RepID=A0ABD6CHJ8_9EURY|nr:hypothetical protein [Halorientalis brevis]